MSNNALQYTMAGGARRAQMSTVRTETVEYRGYELHATEWLGRWEVSISPAIESLPWPRPEDVPAAPTLEEALGKAR
jgi:hypothetical protein